MLRLASNSDLMFLCRLFHYSATAAAAVVVFVLAATTAATSSSRRHRWHQLLWGASCRGTGGSVELDD